jgi:hypothetical protein
MDIGILDALRILFGLLLIFFLPGYLLVKALFPGRNELDKEYNLVYEIGLGMGLSIVIAILDGFFLGSVHQLVGFREDGRGYFDTPYIVASLLIICLLLFVAGFYRGAFPWMGRLHPTLTRVPASEKPQARKTRMDEMITRLWGLSREREKLRREVRDCERKVRAHGAAMKAHYKQRLEQARRRLADIDGQIRELEDRRAEELAGLEDEKDRRMEEKARRRSSSGWFGRKKPKPPTQAGESPTEPSAPNGESPPATSALTGGSPPETSVPSGKGPSPSTPDALSEEGPQAPPGAMSREPLPVPGGTPPSEGAAESSGEAQALPGEPSAGEEE